MSGDLLRGINAYNSANTFPVTPTLPETVASTKENPSPFMGMIKKIVGASSNTIQKSEGVSAASLVEKAPLQSVVLSINEAEIALKTVIAVRDRVINAYQDIIKMPI